VVVHDPFLLLKLPLIFAFKIQANPKGRMWNEKFEGDIGTKSPSRRDSYGGGAAAQQGIRWR
jgi:hypothetical protein